MRVKISSLLTPLWNPLGSRTVNELRVDGAANTSPPSVVVTVGFGGFLPRRAYLQLSREEARALAEALVRQSESGLRIDGIGQDRGRE
jgi:hypothetical protein